jgi:hypothetical protein
VGYTTKRWFLTLFGFALLDLPAAWADIIVTTNPNAPSTDLLASHSLGQSNFTEPWRWIGNAGNDHRDLGQSFLLSATGDSVLDKITVRVSEFLGFGTAVPNAGYTLELWTFTNQFDGIGDMLVNSQTDLLPSSGALSNQYWTFDIENVILSQGQHYGFIFAFNSGPDSQRFVAFVEDFVERYSPGREIARNGTPPNWSSTTHDLEFYLQGFPAASVVPEPSSLTLFGFGSLVVLGYRWRHRGRSV